MTILELEVKALSYFANTSNSRTISKSQGQSFTVPNGTKKIWMTKTLLVQQNKTTTYVSTTRTKRKHLVRIRVSIKITQNNTRGLP